MTESIQQSLEELLQSKLSEKAEGTRSHILLSLLYTCIKKMLSHAFIKFIVIITIAIGKLGDIETKKN